MTLRRSTSSLASLHRFHRADVVVFCEGGQPLEFQDILSGKGTDGTLDAIYWQSLFAPIDNGKIYHFKSVGSKPVLQKMARDVESMSISTVTICMDSDYDRHFRTNRTARRCAYTFGYSWENDVLTPSSLLGLIQNIVVEPRKSKLAYDQVMQTVTSILDRLSKWCEIDASLIRMGKSGVFDRKKPLKCLSIDDESFAIKDDSLKASLTEQGYKRGPRRSVNIDASTVMRDCFGHLWSRICYHVVKLKLKELLGLDIRYEMFIRLAIGQTARLVAAGELHDLQAHIGTQRVSFA